MPIRFLLALVVSTATIAAGLVNPTWYWTSIASVVCFLLLLYALKLAVNNGNNLRFPFSAFVVTTLFVLAIPNTLGTSPVWPAVYALRSRMHPIQETPGKPVLYMDWMGWFDNVAVIAFATLTSLVVFFVASLFGRSLPKHHN